MPHLELSLRCHARDLPRYEQALDTHGALALTLLDAEEGSANEHAILEPGVGQTPLWDDVALSALFDGETDPLALLTSLSTAETGLNWQNVRFRSVDDQHWERAWLDQFQPMRFGQRLWIVPWDHPLPEAAQATDAAVVRLDPGLAFGSGTHPTTALCLRWLDELAVADELTGKTMLDMGCGSGILALAAMKLGAVAAVGIDNDPQAITATRDNAQRNGVQISACLPEHAPERRYPIVLANILASALDALAERLAGYTAPGGRIALSGILHGQEDELMVRYAPWFDVLEAVRDGDWMRITGIRK